MNSTPSPELSEISEASQASQAPEAGAREAPTIDSIGRELARLFDDFAMQTADGDFFFFAGDDRRFPFATIVTSDHDFDNLSRLDRPGVFRLNIGVSKATFQSLFPPDPAPAPAPAQTAASTEAAASTAHELAAHDLAALDRLMPHPVYGRMHWLCVLNPSAATLDRLEPLLREAHDIMAARHGRRAGAGTDTAGTASQTTSV